MQLRTDWSISAALTDVFSSKWINEFRVQYAPQDQEINSLDPRCGGDCAREDQGGWVDRFVLAGAVHGTFWMKVWGLLGLPSAITAPRVARVGLKLAW